MAEFPNLDRAKEFQQAPLGSTSALSQSNQLSLRNVTGNRRALERDYNTALRSLRREARRGNADAAVKNVQLRERAQSLGLQPGGIQSSESRRAGDQAAYNSLVAETQRSQTATAAANNVLGQPSSAVPASGVTPPLQTAPTTQLGRFAQNALGKYSNALSYKGNDPTSLAEQKDTNTFLRQGLDRALGQATTDAERTELQGAGTQLGVTPEAFKKRSDWWKTRGTR